MPGTDITVHVNRGSADTLETIADTVETDSSLVVELHGHERPAHVHCRLEGPLEQIATVGQTNHYVESGSVTAVPISIESDVIDEPIEGVLEIITGYGSESVTIDVTATPPPPTVDVDESLTQPDRDQSAESTPDRLLETVETSGVDPGTVLVVGLGLGALAIATLSAATIGGFAAVVGSVAVLGGVGVALWLLFA